MGPFEAQRKWAKLTARAEAAEARALDYVREHPEYKAMLENLTATQARCTELLDMYRACKRELDSCLLPGWTCPSCKAFTGTAKEKLTKCRCCEHERPKP